MLRIVRPLSSSSVEESFLRQVGVETGETSAELLALLHLACRGASGDRREHCSLIARPDRVRLVGVDPFNYEVSASAPAECSLQQSTC